MDLGLFLRALAGGVAAAVVGLLASHTAGLLVALLVFGAACAATTPSVDSLREPLVRKR